MFWIVYHLVMKLCHLTDRIMNDIFGKILHDFKVWVLNQGPLEFNNLPQLAKNQLWLVCSFLPFWECTLRCLKNSNHLLKIDSLCSIAIVSVSQNGLELIFSFPNRDKNRLFFVLLCFVFLHKLQCLSKFHFDTS